MEKKNMHKRRRMITASLCVFLCIAGAYNCLTHLFVYLDVLIFDLGMLIGDLLLFASYVLMAVGAFRVNRILALSGVLTVSVMKIIGITKEFVVAFKTDTAEQTLSLVSVDVAEVLGLLLTALVIVSDMKASGNFKSAMRKIWFSPALFFSVSIIGSLFSNVGVLSDKTVTMFFLGLSCLSFCVWCTNPGGFVDFVAQRLRENEE